MNTELINENLSYFLLGAWPEGGVIGGVALTLWISLLACTLASAIGLAGGIALTMGGPHLRRVVESIIALLRSIPVIMMFFWCYFLLPILLGVNVPGITTVIVALAIINGAYLSQAVHAGLSAVPVAQWEAALALGFSRWQALRLIILPQGLRIMLPSFINQWVTLIKDTSLAFIVNVPELTMVANQVNNREQVYPLQIFLFVAIMYYIICAGLSTLARKLEAHPAR